MGRTLLALLPALFILSGQARAETIAITDVGVVDVARGRTRVAQTVVIDSGRIRAVGDFRRTPVPADARRIDGRGRFLIPGLWDMGSFVLDGLKEGVPGGLELMVAHGIVGTRDLNTALPPAEVAALVRGIESGAIVGPKLIWTTRALSKTLTANVSGAAASRAEIVDEATAITAVEEAANSGAHYIRVVQNLPEQRLPAIVAAARERRLPVTGAFVGSWKAAAEAGISGFDHFVDLYRSTARRPERDEYLRLYRDGAFRVARANSRDAMYAFFAPLRGLRDEPYYRAAITALARANAPVTTNMATMFWAQLGNADRISTRLKYGYPAPPPPPAPPTAIDGRSRDGLWSDLRDLRDAGVPILAGSGAGGSGRELPGATLHDELVWLVRAGFSPREALAAATITPAAVIARLFPRVRAARRVMAGEPADLVLLDANPLDDIENVRKIRAVVANGRWLGPEERAVLFERAAALAAVKR